MTAQQHENRTSSAAELELELAARRARLAGTLDELMDRVTPKEIARHSVRGVKQKIDEQIRTPDGGLRLERIAAVAAATAAVIAVVVVARRRRP